MLHFTSFMDYNYNLFDLLYYPYIHDNSQGPLKVVINADPYKPYIIMSIYGTQCRRKSTINITIKTW
jgi:hypothetical protein